MKNLTKEQLIKKLTEERDLAIKQLNSIGVGLGDNMDHVKKALEQRLVPCSERLPEEDGIYLLQTESGMMFSGEFCSDMGEFGCWSECYDSCTHALLDRYWVGYGDVVAWMEQPEPYKDGE